MESRRLGHSFVEIAIAVLFLALAMVPLFDSILSGSVRTRQDQHRTFATALAACTIERYRYELPSGAAAAALGHQDDPILMPPDAPDSWLKWRQKFEVVPTVQPLDGATSVLSVEVRWREGQQERSISMRTLLALTYAPGTPGPATP